MDSNGSEQSTLQGNAESHPNQNPMTSSGWKIINDMIEATLNPQIFLTFVPGISNYAS